MELKPEEHLQIFHYYHNATAVNGKLVLKIVKHMNLKQLAMACSILDSTPFARTTGDNWTLDRGHDTLGLRCKPYAYHLDYDTCNINLYLDGRLSNIGTYGNVVQHFFKEGWAIPMFFDKGNENNGKTPFELGVAIPNLIHIKEALNILYDKDRSQIEEWFFDKTCLKIDLTNIDVYEQELTKINNAIAAKR